MPREQFASLAIARIVAPAMPSRAMTRQVADRISSRLASQSTIFGITVPGAVARSLAAVPGQVGRSPSPAGLKAVFLSDVRLTSVVMHATAELQAAREQLISYSGRLIADGLAVGAAGNLSVRAGDVVAITPSGISYDELAGPDICVMGLDGVEI